MDAWLSCLSLTLTWRTDGVGDQGSEEDDDDDDEDMVSVDAALLYLDMIIALGGRKVYENERKVV